VVVAANDAAAVLIGVVAVLEAEDLLVVVVVAANDAAAALIGVVAVLEAEDPLVVVVVAANDAASVLIGVVAVLEAVVPPVAEAKGRATYFVSRPGRFLFVLFMFYFNQSVDKLITGAQNQYYKSDSSPKKRQV
jgi:sugar (pentulose or hexulose) kinase